MIIFMPIAASISDRIGRKPVILTSSIILAICIYPIFLAFGKQNFALAILAQSSFAIILACYMGPIPTLLVEMFPTKVRLTGVALSYNISASNLN
jgi:MHS family proline/betaine transporter-like MFS transporter